MKPLGHVSEFARYPVKSMAGVALDSAVVGWHGFEGDRRFAFRRLGDASGFPWVSASSLPELLLYHPMDGDEPAHVRTPAGVEIALRGEELEREIAARLGSDVELMKFKHGIFDDAAISVITRATMAKISDDAGVPLDTRRFRANVVLESDDGEPFEEDAWVGGTLVFESGPRVSLTARDVRCMMINLDPDTAIQDARMMKTVVRLNENNAGAYGTVVQTGTIRVGDRVSLVTS